MRDIPFLLVLAVAGLTLIAIAAYHGCMLTVTP